MRRSRTNNVSPDGGRLKKGNRRLALGDDIKNVAEKAVGNAKEAIGNATGNDKLVAEGKADQAKAAMRGAASDVKDAARKITGD